MSSSNIREAVAYYSLPHNITTNYPHEHIKQSRDMNRYMIQRTKASAMGFHDMECSHCDAIMYPVNNHKGIKQFVADPESFLTVVRPKSSQVFDRSKLSRSERKVLGKKAGNKSKQQPSHAQLRNKNERSKHKFASLGHSGNVESKRSRDKQLNSNELILGRKKVGRKREQDTGNDLTDAVNKRYRMNLQAEVQKLSDKQIKKNILKKPAPSTILTETPLSRSEANAPYVWCHDDNHAVKTSNEEKKLPAIDSKTSQHSQPKASNLVGRVIPRVIPVEKQVLKPSHTSIVSTSTPESVHTHIESSETKSNDAVEKNTSQGMSQQLNTRLKCTNKRKVCMICQRCGCVCGNKKKNRLKAQDMFVDLSKEPVTPTVEALAPAKKLEEFATNIIIEEPKYTRKITVVQPTVRNITNRIKIKKKRKQKEPVKEAVIHPDQYLSKYIRKVEIIPNNAIEQNLVLTQDWNANQSSTTAQNATLANKKTSIIREVTIIPKEKKRPFSNDFSQANIVGKPIRRAGVPSSNGCRMIGELEIPNYNFARHDNSQYPHYSLDENKKVGVLKEQDCLSDISVENEFSAGLPDMRSMKCLSDISDDEGEFLAESITKSDVIGLSDISDEEDTEVRRYGNQNLSDISDCEQVVEENVITGPGEKSQSSEVVLKPTPALPDATRSVWRMRRHEGKLLIYSGERTHFDNFLNTMKQFEALSRRFQAKITVTGYPTDWTREKLMDTLVNWREMANLHFFPCYIDFKTEKCRFLVKNSFEALEYLLNNGLVVHGDGYRLNLGVRDVKFRLRFRFNEMSRLRTVCNEAYDEEERAVNLKSFMLGSDANKYVYCPLSKVYNQKFIVNLVSDINWSRVTRLNLSSNRLTTIEGFNLVEDLPCLVDLDLSDNLFTSVKQLVSCFGCSATSVKLEGNPLSLNFIQKDEYSDAVKVVFPKIVHLDGVRISGLPEAQRNFCPHPEAAPFVEHFLNVYFGMAESRTPMTSLYSVGAMLTISCEGRLKKLPQYESVPMVRACRDVRLLNEVFEECLMGNTAIAEALESHPPVNYDASTFTVDVLHFTDKYAIMTVTGTLRVLDRARRADGPLLDFTRTFVLSSRDRNEFVVNNDMWHLAEPTPDRRNAAFVKFSPRPQPRLQLESAPSEELKTELIEIFANVTGRPHSESLRCLEMRNWNMRSALQYFVRQTEKKLANARNQAKEEKEKFTEAASEIQRLPAKQFDGSCMKLETTHESCGVNSQWSQRESFEHSADSKAEQMYANFANSPDNVGYPEYLEQHHLRRPNEHMGHPASTGYPEQRINQPMHEQAYGNFGPPMEEPLMSMYEHPIFMQPQQEVYGNFNYQSGNFHPRPSMGEPSHEINYGVPHWNGQ